MKKFIIIVTTIVLLVVFADYLYYHQGIYLDIGPDKEPTTFIRTEGEYIYMDKGEGYERFTIRGVDLGSGVPGEWSTDFGASKEDYLRWFELIQEMGANTIRVYTLNDDTFYNAFYEYNKDNPDPLWLIQGIWVSDYLYNSHRDAYHPELMDRFIEDSKTMIDVIHGNRKIALGRVVSSGSGTYNKDISQWVIGYILGVEWEDRLVAHTNDKYKNDPERSSYTGKYMYSGPDATPFEAMLAGVGDAVIAYETQRYGTQKLVAFSNWPITDPFEYPQYITDYFSKCACVDVENILWTDKFLSGQFASYHVYPYYRDYLAYVTDFSELTFKVDLASCYTEDGILNTYKLYLKALADHHDIPLVISEFGIPTGRGIAHVDVNTGRNQGHMKETEQGPGLVECYEDIMSAGAAGCCLFSWQDEWFKRTWNTNYAVDLIRTPYWSDYQTNEQYFGLLSFDPGEEKCVSYVDGDVSEWTADDLISQNGDMKLSMKYDEQFIYLMVEKPQLELGSQTIYIPFDTNPKIGSSRCEDPEALFDRAADFLLVLDGEENSRLLVQERYEPLRSTYAVFIDHINAYDVANVPDADSPEFEDINIIIQMIQLAEGLEVKEAELFPTGDLIYGNANPESPEFNSLADFISSGNYIEIRLPWQLLNFYDPSRMMIHDDYYDGNYGVEHLPIKKIYVGIGTAGTQGRIHLDEVPMKGWNNDVTYHERLKPSYYVMQECWLKEKARDGE